jgi:enoyl-CoA hydratase
MADIVVDRRDGIARVVLNRPDALNALTLDMCLALDAWLGEWQDDPSVEAVQVRGQGSRAFCAGGDIRRLYEERTGDYPRQFYRAEYRLNARLHRFSKPYIAFLDGIVMGGGVGVSVHGSHRIATEHTQFAMPETGIGLFPDVGGSYFLSRCPGALGMYLGLTGARLAAADAIYCGIAQYVAPAQSWAALSGTASVARIAQPAAPAQLARHRALIDRCFGKDSVEEILATLEAEQDRFASEALVALDAKSPTSLKITHRQIRSGRALDFDSCMRMEWRMVNRVIAGHDFYEGTRAAIIEKDRKPRWQPARLEEVTEAEVAPYFAPLPGDELHFDWEQ